MSTRITRRGYLVGIGAVVIVALLIFIAVLRWFDGTPATAHSAPQSSIATKAPRSPAPSTAKPTRSSASASPIAGGLLLSESDLTDARRHWGGRVGIAAVGLDGGSVAVTNGDGPPFAWSTTKLLISAQLLRDVGGPSALSIHQRSMMNEALSASVNEAATSMNTDVKNRHGGVVGAAAAMTGMLRQAGDETTDVRPGATPESNYGLTQWDAKGEALFMAALARGCLLDSASSKFLIGEMGHVVEGQTWGLGRIGSPAYKGGWGPDDNGTYLVRQVGLVRAPDGHEYAVAITARAAGGSQDSGQRLLSEVAEWLAQRITSAPAATACQ